MLKKSQKHVWNEVGGSAPDFTSASSAMPGGPDIDYNEHEPIVIDGIKPRMPADYYKNESHKKAMTAPIDVDRIRKSGF